MGNHFGVDSAGYAADLWQSVVNTFGVPDFWGRYLTAYILTVAERDFLLGKGCAILPIYNSASAQSVAGGYDQGWLEGQRAVSAANALSVPAGVFIPADIETNFNPTGEWVKGYIECLAAGGFTGGLYCNPSVPSHSAAYQWARANSTAPALVYSSEWEPFALAGVRTTDFTPLGVPGHEADSAVWQFCENTLNQTIDLDVAGEAHWAALWHPVPIVPPVVAKHVKIPGSLKVAASHSSAVALDPHLHAVWCEPGVTLIPTGPAVHTDDDWLPVRLDAPERIVHGFYPVASLA